jgi:hypothetical protein
LDQQLTFPQIAQLEFGYWECMRAKTFCVNVSHASQFSTGDQLTFVGRQLRAIAIPNAMGHRNVFSVFFWGGGLSLGK